MWDNLFKILEKIGVTFPENVRTINKPVGFVHSWKTFRVEVHVEIFNRQSKSPLDAKFAKI